MTDRFIGESNSRTEEPLEIERHYRGITQDARAGYVDLLGKLRQGQQEIDKQAQEALRKQAQTQARQRTSSKVTPRDVAATTEEVTGVPTTDSEAPSRPGFKFFAVAGFFILLGCGAPFIVMSNYLADSKSEHPSSVVSPTYTPTQSPLERLATPTATGLPETPIR